MTCVKGRNINPERVYKIPQWPYKPLKKVKDGN